MSTGNPKSNPPQIAVAGAGLIGRTHIKIAAEAGALGAIIDPNEAASELAQDMGCPWFATLDECLDAQTPDGVIIATPNQLHVEHGISCVSKGIPLLIEKPIADDAEEAQTLLNAAKQANVPVLVGHHRRHNPIIKAAKAAIDAGELGRIVAVHAQFWLCKPTEYFDVAWRRAKGAGPIYINLIHDIDLLRHLCGDVTSVQAIQSSNTRGNEVEDSAVIIVAFENGALGTISVSDAIPAPWSWELTAAENPAYPVTDAHCYMIGGTKGSMSIPDLRVWEHPGKQSWWEPINARTLDVENADPLPLQFQNFLDVINGTADPVVSGQEGLATLRVVNAIKKAAESGVSHP